MQPMGAALDRAARAAWAHEHVVAAAEALGDRPARLQPRNGIDCGETGGRRLGRYDSAVTAAVIALVAVSVVALAVLSVA